MIAEILERPAAKRMAIACVAALLFAGVVALASHTDSGVGDARLHAKGHAAVTSAAGTRRTVTGTVALHRGDVVEAVDDAISIDLPDGSTVEGRPGRGTVDATRVKIATPVELLAGDLLVVATNGAAVDAGGNIVRLDRAFDGTSAARVSRTLAVAAGVYRGSATFDSAGQTRSLPALRSIEVSTLGRAPTAVSPLKVADDDAWDRRFLGEAMDLGHTLDNYANSFSDTVGRTATFTPGLYRQIVPSVSDEASLTTELLDATPHPPGETLVGVAIAGLGRRGDFAGRFHDVFGFRDAGANWGLVALDQGVARDPLLTDMQQALNASPLPFAQAARTPPTATTAPGSAPTVPPTTAGGGGGTTTTTSPNQPPPTTTTLVPPTGQPLVDGLVDTVNQVLGGVLGGGRGRAPGS